MCPFRDAACSLKNSGSGWSLLSQNGLGLFDPKSELRAGSGTGELGSGCNDSWLPLRDTPPGKPFRQVALSGSLGWGYWV